MLYSYAGYAGICLMLLLLAKSTLFSLRKKNVYTHLMTLEFYFNPLMTLSMNASDIVRAVSFFTVVKQITYTNTNNSSSDILQLYIQNYRKSLTVWLSKYES
jgi:hypothetical protein